MRGLGVNGSITDNFVFPSVVLRFYRVGLRFEALRLKCVWFTAYIARVKVKLFLFVGVEHDRSG